MRTLFFITAISISTAVTAQDVKQNDVLPKQRKNEIGFVSDLGLSSNNSGIGILYKHWINDYKGIRANVSYLGYSYTNSKIFFPAQGDTVFSKQAFTDISTIYASIGAEMQRQFYKRVYMYAAIDLYAAYGTGNTEEILSKELSTNNTNERLDYAVGATYSSTLFRIGVMPMVGVKFNLSRVSFGTELSGILTEYKSLKHSNGMPSDGGIMDFSMGHFTQRVFVTFRF